MTDPLPLAGRRVVVTRAAEQAPALATALAALGAEPVLLPAIAFVAPEDQGAALRNGLGQLESYDWLLMTSVNTVDRVAAEIPLGKRGSVPTAVIGARTAEAAAAAGFRVELVPDDFVGEGLLAVMPAAKGAGRVLFPRAAIGRETLLDGLAAKGWQVDLVETYQTVTAPMDEAAKTAAIGADAVTFTSPSTFHAYVEHMGDDLPIVVSIGPVTTAAIRDAGVSVDLEAAPHTIDGIVSSLIAYWTSS